MPRCNARGLSWLLSGPVLLCPILAATVAAADGQQSRDAILVSARVVPVARLIPADVPAELRLTATDLARGYTDVEATYELFANARNGYRIRIAIEGEAIKSVETAPSGALAGFEGAGGELLEQPGRVIRERVLLRLRLQLRPGLAPGRFDWPIRINAEPL